MTRSRLAALTVVAAVALGGAMLVKPGWNSLTSVTSLQRGLETSVQSAAVAVVVLGLLQMVYARRKEALQELENTRQIASLRTEAEAQVAAARAEVVALDEKYAPRRLTEEQSAALQRVLSGRSGSPVDIHSVSGDPETAEFGIRLERALSAAGWEAKHENMAFFGAPHGLEIRCPGPVSDPRPLTSPNDVSCRGATVLARALVEAGHDVRVVVWPATAYQEEDRKKMQLVVGYKPIKL
jgi:hypothetical protein